MNKRNSSEPNMNDPNMNEPRPLPFGPGSQPSQADDEKFDYMEMPKTMATFAMPDIPEPEDTTGMNEAKAVLEGVRLSLCEYKVGDEPVTVNLAELDKQNLGLVNQIMGEGEVAIVAGPSVQAQESVLAGVWRVHHLDKDGALVRDTIELGAHPGALRGIVFEDAKTSVQLPAADEAPPEGVYNAPSILVEIAEKVATYSSGAPAHAINLSLLPLTEQDVNYLGGVLGAGNTIVLSRGYGNCRVSSTGTNNVWWVQYFNSQDALILNTFEIVDIPEVVLAAQEDIDESAERLGEILEVYR